MKDLQTLFLERFGTGAPVPATNFNYQPIASMLNRRSARKFADRPLGEGMLEVLLACAQSAPSKSDLQQYSIVVVDDMDMRVSISNMVRTMPWIEQAPVFLLFCADIHRNRTMGDVHDLTHDNDNVDSFMNASVDCALAMQNFINAAEKLGLGCCPVSVVRNYIEEICALIEAPQGVFPVAGLACGWPVGETTTSLRLPPSVVIHHNQYQSEDTAKQVLDYDKRRRAREPIGEKKQRHVNKYGAKKDIGWSENAARQLSVPERAAFKAFLKRQGFNLE